MAQDSKPEPSGAAQHARFGLVLICFFVSGLAGLLYETAWTREFAFVFGTSELATATVLAGYMGGLAIGAAIAARFAGRLRRPVLVYGLLELGIAITALAVPFAVRLAMQGHAWIFAANDGALGHAGWASVAYYLLASFAILAPPTVMMGATLPLLAGHAVRDESGLSRRVGVLYGTNTIGAVGGVVMAGFVLLPALGLEGTVAIAAALNVMVFLLAALLSRGAPAPVAAEAAQDSASTGMGWILPVIALSGAASFTYEVTWTRLLVHLLGGSVYAFATMLASFLLGIAIGSAAASRRVRSPASAAAAFAGVQLCIAFASLAAYFFVDALPELALALEGSGLGRQTADAVLSGLILLPAAVFIGATFPLAVRALARDAHQAGAATGRVYAWNTAGSIVGAIGSGFVLIPAFGFGGTMGLAALANAVLALIAASFAGGRGVRRWAVLGVAGALAVGLLVLPPPEPDRLLRTGPFGRRPMETQTIFQAAGRSASVRAAEGLGEWTITTNGLPEASVQPPGGRPAKFALVRWLGMMPGLLRPETETMLVIGFGGGGALEMVPASISAIDVVELEPEVLEANEFLASRRGVDPLQDERVRVHLNDARNGLLLAGRRFDAIVSQPSHPWTAGASHLYTVEFFELIRAHLEEGGIFVQWIGLGFVDEPLLRNLAASLAEVFPHLRAYRPIGIPGVLFAASDRPFASAREIDDAIAAERALFERIGIATSGDLADSLILAEEDISAFVGDAALNRDRRNRLQSHSPRVGLARSTRHEFPRLEELDPLRNAPAATQLRAVRRLLERKEWARATRVESAIEPGPEKQVAAAMLASARGGRNGKGGRLERALATSPQLAEGRALWLRTVSTRTPPEPMQPLTPLEAAVRRGAAIPPARWSELAELEPVLAAAPAEHPLYRAALGLRARARASGGGAEDARAAITLLDRATANGPTATDLLLRANLTLQAGWVGAAVGSLVDLLTLHPQLDAARLAGVRGTLAAFPADPEALRWRRQLELWMARQAARREGRPRF